MKWSKVLFMGKTLLEEVLRYTKDSFRQPSIHLAFKGPQRGWSVPILTLLMKIEIYNVFFKNT